MGHHFVDFGDLRDNQESIQLIAGPMPRFLGKIPGSRQCWGKGGVINGDLWWLMVINGGY